MKLLAGPQPCAGATSQLYGGTSPSPEMTRPVPQGSQWMPSGAPWPHALPLLSIRCVCVCVCVCVCANRPPGEGLQCTWGGGPGSIRGGVLKADV